MSACTFFGHRQCQELKNEILWDAIYELIDQGVELFFVGKEGAFDRKVYRCLKSIQRICPHIGVYVVLSQLPTKKEEWEALPDSMYPEIEGLPKFGIDRRNRWMINMSSYCLCYVNHTWGGAFKYAQKAKRRNLTVINLGSVEL